MLCESWGMEDPTQKEKITAAQARALLPELNASGLPLADRPTSLRAATGLERLGGLLRH